MNKYIEVCNDSEELVLISKDSIVSVSVAIRNGGKVTAIAVGKGGYREYVYTYTSYKRIKDLLISEGNDKECR